MFEEKNLIPYIFEMYEQYHVETLKNAFVDLDEQLGLLSNVIDR